jgi:hypothetical protein
MQEARAQTARAIEQNRTLPVQKTANGQKSSGKVYEVTDGFKYIRNEAKELVKLGPGQRFIATESEARTNRRGRSPLDGKARPLGAAELSGVRSVMGADIGLRAILPENVVKFAMSKGLSETDFAGMTPEGDDGRFTRAQVEAVITAKKN